jgi:hypothetical protein
MAIDVPSVCLLAVLVAAAPLWIYFRLRADFEDLRLTAVRPQHMYQHTGALDGRLATLESRLAELEEMNQRQADWAAQAESLHLDRRGQVLRLYRRGESVAGIASALQMGPGEVHLMIKVYELAAEPGSLRGSEQNNTNEIGRIANAR